MIHMVLLIRAEDIWKANITPEEAIEAVEDAYRQDGKGHAQDTSRAEVVTKGKGLPHIAPGTHSIGQTLAYLEESKVVVLSNRFSYLSHKSITHLIEPRDGKTLAIISTGDLSQKAQSQEHRSKFDLRTGSAAAIGAKYLARKNIDTVGSIGAGRIGQSSLLCLSKVREFNKVYVYDHNIKQSEEFATKMGGILGIDIIATDKPEEVVRNSDVLITATPSTEPIVKGEWIREGTHISAIGADCPLKAELDVVTFKRADKIVIDSEKCLTIGELANAIKQEVLRPEDIYGKIGEVVAGVKPGREDNSEITIFESDGTNIQTASIQYLIYQKVKEKGLGLEISKLPSYFINI